MWQGSGLPRLLLDALPCCARPFAHCAPPASGSASQHCASPALGAAFFQVVLSHGPFPALPTNL